MRVRTGEDNSDGDEKRRLRVQDARVGMPAGRSFCMFRLLRLGERELDLLLDLLFDLFFEERELDLLFDLFFEERELDLFLFVVLFFFLAPPLVLDGGFRALLVRMPRKMRWSRTVASALRHFI